MTPVSVVRPVLRLPLGKLPLPLLVLEKGLYLRKQDTGQGLHFMVGYSRAVVVGFLLITFNYKEGETRLDFTDIESSNLKSVGGPCGGFKPLYTVLVSAVGTEDTSSREAEAP